MAGKYMEETEIDVNPAVTEERLATLIEEAATRYGLRSHMKGTLRTYPGSQHWHLQKPGERGTLEVSKEKAMALCAGWATCKLDH